MQAEDRWLEQTHGLGDMDYKRCLLVNSLNCSVGIFNPSPAFCGTRSELFDDDIGGELQKVVAALSVMMGK